MEISEGGFTNPTQERKPVNPEKSSALKHTLIFFCFALFMFWGKCNPHLTGGDRCLQIHPVIVKGWRIVKNRSKNCKNRSSKNQVSSLTLLPSWRKQLWHESVKVRGEISYHSITFTGLETNLCCCQEKKKKNPSKPFYGKFVLTKVCV